MNRRQDIRIGALWATIFAVIVLGLVLALVPGTHSQSISLPAANESINNRAQSTEGAHARSMRDKEIAERFAQATAMLHARQYDYALTALHRLLQLAPKLPEAHVNIGFALLGQQEFGAARDFFRSAIELRPGQANAYYGLAMALEHLCDLRGAIGAMRTYVHLSKSDERFLRKARAALWEWETAGTNTDENLAAVDVPVPDVQCRAQVKGVEPAQEKNGT